MKKQTHIYLGISFSLNVDLLANDLMQVNAFFCLLTHGEMTTKRSVQCDTPVSTELL